MQTVVTPTTNQLPIQVNKHLVTFCTAAVFLYALSRLWIGAKISAYFEAAFLLPFYYVVFKNWWYFKKQFLTWLVIAMLAIPILQFFVHYYQNPILAMKYQGVDKLFRLTFFLAPAFWLAHNLKLVSWFIIANLLALLILLSQPNLELYVNHVLAGHRTNWGTINAQFTAMYAGIGLLASLCLLHSAKQWPAQCKNPLLVFNLICVISTVFVLFASQTRAAIGGLLIAASTTGALLIYHQHISIKKVFKSPAFIIGFLAAIIGLTSALNQSSISNKLKKDWEGVISNQEGLIPNKLGGGRGELWKFGYHKIAEKPLLGWGGESRKDLIKESTQLSNRTKDHLWHLHNSWLEYGLTNGVLGITLLTLLLLKIFQTTIQSWGKNQIPNNIAVLTSLTLVFMVFMNIFESYLFFWQGGYLLIWCCAPAFAHLFNPVAQYQQTKGQPFL